MFPSTNLIQWCSKKQKVIVLSSTEVEYKALTHIVTKVAWIKTLFIELGLTLSFPPIIHCDNQSVGFLASNPIFHAYTKLIEIDVHYIRDQISAKNVTIHYVLTKLQKANILIKPLPAHKFEFCKTALQIFPSSTYEKHYRTTNTS